MMNRMDVNDGDFTCFLHTSDINFTFGRYDLNRSHKNNDIIRKENLWILSVLYSCLVVSDCFYSV